MLAEWQYIVRPCRNGVNGWLGLAKRGAWITDGDAIKEPGDVRFEFGATEAEARARIEADCRARLN